MRVFVTKVFRRWYTIVGGELLSYSDKKLKLLIEIDELAELEEEHLEHDKKRTPSGGHKTRPYIFIAKFPVGAGLVPARGYVNIAWLRTISFTITL